MQQIGITMIRRTVLLALVLLSKPLFALGLAMAGLAAPADVLIDADWLAEHIDDTFAL